MPATKCIYPRRLDAETGQCVCKPDVLHRPMIWDQEQQKCVFATDSGFVLTPQQLATMSAQDIETERLKAQAAADAAAEAAKAARDRIIKYTVLGGIGVVILVMLTKKKKPQATATATQ